MLKIVLDAGYRGYIGIEYEGKKLSEADGVRATKKLLETVREELKGSYAAPSAAPGTAAHQPVYIGRPRRFRFLRRLFGR
jgi:hypothetical protein